jgi:hypothetical protein
LDWAESADAASGRVTWMRPSSWRRLQPALQHAARAAQSRAVRHFAVIQPGIHAPHLEGAADRNRTNHTRRKKRSLHQVLHQVVNSHQQLGSLHQLGQRSHILAPQVLGYSTHTSTLNLWRTKLLSSRRCCNALSLNAQLNRMLWLRVQALSSAFKLLQVFRRCTIPHNLEFL